MLDLTDSVISALGKPASQWGNEEGAAVYKAIKQHGRAAIEKKMNEIRAEIAKSELA